MNDLLYEQYEFDDIIVISSCLCTVHIYGNKIYVNTNAKYPVNMTNRHIIRYDKIDLSEFVDYSYSYIRKTLYGIICAFAKIDSCSSMHRIDLEFLHNIHDCIRR